MRSYQVLLREAASRLIGDEARLEAEILLGHAVARSRAWLIAHGEDVASADEAARFERLVQGRLLGEPIAYLIGTRGFWDMDLQVDPRVLIPRPETERLVELALERLPSGTHAMVLDLGTGSGAIALAIAKERPQAAVIAVDRSEAALQVARGNAARTSIANVEFRIGDWFDAVSIRERFDVIVSNPPYIRDADEHLSQGDLRFEPRVALSSGFDGLEDIRRIVAGAPEFLQSQGWLLLEHGHDQGEAVRALLSQQGFKQVATVQDWESRDRVSVGRWV